MKKSLLVLLLVGLIFSCNQEVLSQEEVKEEVKTYYLNNLISFDSIDIVFTEVTYLSEERFAIYVSITNTSSQIIDYSYIWSWGNILSPNGNQFGFVTLLGYDKGFNGYEILPGATIEDVLTTESFDYKESGVYTFYVDPPIDDTKEFLLKFNSDSLDIELYEPFS